METTIEKITISDEIVVEFIHMLEISRDVQFAIGDRLLEVIRMHGGKRAGVIAGLSGQLGISPSSLYDYCRISEKWPPALREEYQSLDWTIYRNADPVADRDLLDRAVDEAWTATRFREEKYAGMQEPARILGRVESIIRRGMRFIDKRWQADLDYILQKLRRIILEEQSGHESEPNR